MPDSALPDPANQARQIAEVFANMSRTVDAYLQDHLKELSPDQQDYLDNLVRQLDDTHDRFTAMAIEDTLKALRDDLSEIAAVTGRAEHALKHLERVGEVMKLAGGLAELCADITTADFGAIPSALANIVEAIPAKV